MAATRVPPNLFGVPFGLAGLGVVWSTMSKYDRAPHFVAEALFAASALVWLIMVAWYLQYGLAHRGTIRADLTDTIMSPFTAVSTIVPMLLSAQAVFPFAPTAGRVLTNVFLAMTVLLGSWLTSQWMSGPLDLDRFHPGYLLPTVAGGMLASAAAAAIGERQIAMAAFGIGLVCWLSLGSLVVGRLMFCQPLPLPLMPTLAIEIAPAATASLAWFTIDGDKVDIVIAVMGGYGLFMVLAQARFITKFLRMPFMPSAWSFTFTWAAAAATVLHWLHDNQPAGAGIYEYLTAAVITILIAGIAVRTLMALARGQLLPKQSAQKASAPVSEPVKT
jgi:tellurite resistance protein